MSLTKADRIIFSKKIVEADPLKAIIDQSKASLEAKKLQAEELDAGNKRLVDARTDLINPYEVEIARYDGLGRTHLTEAIIQDSANRVVGNHLFPNDPNNPPPSLAPFTWTKAKPYARTAAVGKQTNESFASPVSAEQSKLQDIIDLINKIQTDYTVIQRVTGEQCIPGIFPDPDIIASYPALVADYNQLVSYVNDLKPYVLATQSLIFTGDPNTTRQAQNNAAISDINNIVAAIDLWLTYPEFDNTHGQTSCSGFNSYNPELLDDTRLHIDELAALKTAMLSRQTFVNTRVSQINTNLGIINQDLSTAEATGSGLYFERWSFLLLRLNLFEGSLTEAKGFDSALAAQDAQKEQIDLFKSSYSSLLTASLLSAPANGTKVLHVKSSQGFSAGDAVYLVSETQDEITLNIETVEGNRIVVGSEIPAKYRPQELARLYKELA